MSEWISVNDALPSQRGQYLVLILEEANKRSMLLDVWTGKEWHDNQYWCPWIKITHWMQLPEMPKEDK